MRHLTFGVALLLVLAVMSPPQLAAQDTQDRAAKSAPASINLNTATAAQLEALPGIGPKLAERILDYRKKNGAFKKVEDLMNIQGLGEKNFLKLKPLLSVQPVRADSAQADHR